MIHRNLEMTEIQEEAAEIWMGSESVALVLAEPPWSSVHRR